MCVCVGGGGMCVLSIFALISRAKIELVVLLVFNVLLKLYVSITLI